MLTERENKELLKKATEMVIILGGLLTFAYVIYFLVDYFKKWS